MKGSTKTSRLIVVYFIKHFIQFIGMSILPLLILYSAFSIILIPSERNDMETSTFATLKLVEENISLLLNDTSKIMDTIDTSISSYVLNTVFESDIEGYIGSYVELLTCKQIALYMNSIANTRDYIDSVYVYLPNNNKAYITNQMNIYRINSSPDPHWMEECESDKPHDIFRRTIPGKRYDIITITEKNQRGYIVAININASYFERLFKQMTTIDQQKIILVKDTGDAIASNSSQFELEEIFDGLKQSKGKEYFSYNDISIFSIPIDDYNAFCVSAIPNAILFSYEKNLLAITITISIICIIISLLISLLYSYRMTDRIKGIMQLFQYSSDSNKLKNVKPDRNDAYGYITNNLIKTFLQHYNMKVALNEKKMELKVQELSALQYQINPHFLSNTLQMIDFEILRLTQKPTKANHMIEGLSRFLQYSLRNPENLVFLWQEVKATKDYTDIMKERFLDQISFSWQVAEDCMNFEIPKLSLQPLLENAIQHNAQKSNVLTISFSAWTENNQTILKIKDDGVGVGNEQLEQIKKNIECNKIKENHIGLSNIIRRFKLEYEDSFSYSIKARPNEGFSIMLFIKERKEKEE